MMVKDLVLGEIEDKLKSTDDTWVQRWVDDEVSILDEFIKPNQSLLNSCKCTSLETVDTITFRDLQDCCIRGRSDYYRNRFHLAQNMQRSNLRAKKYKSPRCDPHQ